MVSPISSVSDIARTLSSGDNAYEPVKSNDGRTATWNLSALGGQPVDFSRLETAITSSDASTAIIQCITERDAEALEKRLPEGVQVEFTGDANTGTGTATIQLESDASDASDASDSGGAITGITVPGQEHTR